MNYLHKMPLLIPLGGWLLGIYLAEKYDCHISEIYTFLCLLLSILFYILDRRKSHLWTRWGLCGAMVAAFVCESVVLYQMRRPVEMAACRVSMEAVCSEAMGRGCVVESADVRYYLSTDSVFVPGDVLQLTGRIAPVRKSAGDGFSFDDYLRKQNICYRIYLESEPVYCGRENSFFNVMQSVRGYLVQKCGRLLPDQANRGVVEALCLGYKQDLSSEVRQLFEATGTVHLLAVSGLHTGAIFLLMSLLMKWLRIRNRRVRVLLLLLLLWMYACITGLPPSVVRAALILTFITCGDLFCRDYLPINAIAAAALVSLVVNPFALWSVSMQMSYAAYCGIILIYPWLNRLTSKWLCPKYVRSLLCVTLAAQIATLPLSMAYFHTINLTGIISNLLAVPLTTCLLYVSTLMLFLPVAVASPVGWAVNMLIECLRWILTQFRWLNFNFNDVYISDLQMFLLYMLILFVLLYLHFRSRKSVVLLCLLVFVSLFSICIYEYDKYTLNEVVLYKSNRKSVVAFNNYGTVYAPSMQSDLKKYAKNQEVDTNFSRVFLWNGAHVQVVDSFFHLKGGRDVLIVKDNVLPNRYLQNKEKLISQVVVSTSVKNHVRKRWQKYCEQNQIAFISSMGNEFLIFPLQ